MHIAEWIKHHPYEAGGIAIVTGLVAYVLLAGKQSGGSSTASLQSQELAANTQLAQVNAASNAQIAQVQAQQNIAQIQANAAANQVAAQQSSSDALTAAQLVASLNTNQSSVALGENTNAANLAALENTNGTQASVANNLINSELEGEENSNSTLLSAYGLQTNYLTQALNDQYSLENQGVGLVSSGKLNLGGGEGGLNQVAFLDSLLGNPGGSATASAEAGGVAESGNALLASIISSIGKAAGSVAAGL